jgi:hypothetical protein
MMACSPTLSSWIFATGSSRAMAERLEEQVRMQLADALMNSGRIAVP